MLTICYMICAHSFAGNTLDWPIVKAVSDQIRKRGVEVYMHVAFLNEGTS